MRTQIRLGVLLVLFGAAACGPSTPEIKAGNMPDGGNFSGVYFSQQYGTMNMVQNGNAVVGEYESDMRSGKIQGEVQGDLLRFEWIENKAMVSNRATETKGHGYFRYLVDAGNGQHLLKGEWGLGDKEVGGGPWNAYKAKGKEPQLKGGSGSSSGGESEGSDDSSDDSEDSKEGDDLF
jgi:hypothetical protein